MKKIIVGLGILIAGQGVYNLLQAAMKGKGVVSPKEYVMSGMVSYPDIVAIRSNVEHLTDEGLVEKFMLAWGSSAEEGYARLKAVRDLTSEDLEQKKREYEMYNK